MERINDPQLLQSYLEQYHLQEHFTGDLAQMGMLLRYAPNEKIAQIGVRCEYFYILVKGECMAYAYTATNKIHCESYFHGVSLLGVAATLWDEPLMNSVRALTECIFIAIPANLYRHQLLNDNKFLRFAVRTLATHVRQSASHFDPLENRLASFILTTQRGGLFRYNLTQCADIMETSYRHLMRTLSTLCSMGILQKGEKGDYTILNQTLLEELSRGDLSSGSKS